VVRPETRYLRTADGVYIAYQVVGAGAADVALDFHHFAGNVDLVWEEPDLGPMLETLAAFARVIVHDRRGTGVSSRNVPPPNLETRAADLLAVLDEVGSAAPVLAAGASTGAMHALFAAQHPERVSAVFWNYPRPRLAWDPDYPWGQRPEDFEAALVEGRRWGTTDYVRELALSRAAQRAGVPHEERHRLQVDDDALGLYARINRNTASPDVAEALTRISWQTDVRQILSSVQAPAALVVGETDGEAEREEAEYVASLMPDATVHVLPGRSGFNVAAQAKIIRDLAGVEPPREEPSTVLATLLFTDIVESAQRQALIGDRAWRDLVLAHHAAVRTALARWDGREHDTAGDGFFASFTGPARAVRCANEIAERVAALELDTRAAVHIGECELIDGKPGGVAVTIAARALATARGREVIVTQTVKDLVAGSGFRFDDHGEHDLKGVPDRWHLYAVAATTER
jgi:class 3 adenylate cyclase/pimeloyl-ACP methyl ester carboxylesterase